MKNKLAFQTLDADMFNLKKCYSEPLNAFAKAELVSVLQFVKYTSAMLSLFTDSRPIKDLTDTRLKTFTGIQFL